MARKTHVKSGATTSCGCYMSEWSVARFTTHGQTNTGTYKSWKSMLARCEQPRHPHYENYGGRGIAVCERWHRFAEFYADMGDRPEGLTLDRIDNDGNYAPGNCRWATRRQQWENSRANPNRPLSASDPKADPPSP